MIRLASPPARVGGIALGRPEREETCDGALAFVTVFRWSDATGQPHVSHHSLVLECVADGLAECASLARDATGPSAIEVEPRGDVTFREGSSTNLLLVHLHPLDAARHDGEPFALRGVSSGVGPSDGKAFAQDVLRFPRRPAGMRMAAVSAEVSYDSMTAWMKMLRAQSLDSARSCKPLELRPSTIPSHRDLEGGSSMASPREG